MRSLLTILVFFAFASLTPAEAQSTATLVEVHGPAGILRGTLLSPQSGVGQVVLIIPGSGPTDRDGNNPLGINASPYRLLAEGLAERGVSSVRIDKRGLFQSAAPGLDPNAVTVPDYAADVHAWTAEIKRITGAHCVWIAGHSEGALVAEAAVQSDPNACGLILLSGAGRKMGDVLRAQILANPANAALVEPSNHIIAELEAGRGVDAASVPPPLLPLFRPPVQGFLISLFSLDPPQLLRSYAGPVLVMQGSTDLQVSMADAEALAAARPGIELVRLEGVNHVLKVAQADRAANIATYADPSLPLAPGIADRIAAFVAQQR